MEELLQEINRIRNIRDKIKSDITIESQIPNDILKSNLLLSNYDKQLVSIYLKTIQEIAILLIDNYGETQESEKLLKYILDNSTDTELREQAFEKLLTIAKLQSNPYNNINEVKNLIEKLHIAFSKYYHPDNLLDGMNYHSNPAGINVIVYMKHIDSIFSDEVISKLCSIQSLAIRRYIIEKLLIYVNSKEGLFAGLTNEYIRKFFSRIKVIVSSDEELLSRVNERIYNIPIQTHGLINKLDSMKDKLFGKRNKK